MFLMSVGLILSIFILGDISGSHDSDVKIAVLFF